MDVLVLIARLCVLRRYEVCRMLVLLLNLCVEIPHQRSDKASPKEPDKDVTGIVYAQVDACPTIEQ